MGAWGMGVFDDDTSCEIIEDAIDNDTSIDDLIHKGLSSLSLDYLEYTECHEIIVAGAMVDAVVNGTGYEGVENLDGWLAKQKKEHAIPYQEKLVVALKRVLGEDSELNELWAENEDDYPTWKSNIEAVISAISR